MKTRAVRDGDFWVLNGVKRWITNASVSDYYTVMAVTDPRLRTRAYGRRFLEALPPARIVSDPGAVAEFYGDGVRATG